MAKASKRGYTLKEVIVFSDRCGEQFSGKKNFRMCSETAQTMLLVVLWIFACPHHFAGVWDAWGGSEAKLLRNVEKMGHATIRTVIDCVVKLRQLRAKLIGTNNDLADSKQSEGDGTDDSEDDSDDDGDDDNGDDSTDDNDDDGDDLALTDSDPNPR